MLPGLRPPGPRRAEAASPHAPSSSGAPPAAAARPLGTRSTPRRGAAAAAAAPPRPPPPPRAARRAPPRRRVAAAARRQGGGGRGPGGDGGDDAARAPGAAAAAAAVGAGFAALALGGFLARDAIAAFLDLFTRLVEDWGPAGYAAYIAVYAALELLAVPAIPLTMTAGAIFGVLPGTAVVSAAAALASTGAFLIARYVARDRVLAYAAKNPRFAAVDRAVGRDGFRVVLLLRLSPLLPFAASNYLYGLTSVELGPYALASWLGMLPGTAAYVSAGVWGKELLEGGGAGGGAGGHGWQLAAGAALTAAAVWYVGRLARDALAEVGEGDE